MLHAGGKVVAPLFRARPAATHLDRAGELRPARYEPDAGLHVEGDGETAWGVKFVLVAARTIEPHGRIILDVEWVTRPGGDARTAVEYFTRIAPHLSGAQGVIYDTALRGVHHRTLLRDLGWLPVNRVTGAKANSAHARRAERRVEKSSYTEDRSLNVDGRERHMSLYARGGAVGIGELTETGDLDLLTTSALRRYMDLSIAGSGTLLCPVKW